MKSTKKMIDWLYKSDDCSDFQKGLRFKMWSRYIMRKFNAVDVSNYKLNDKEFSLLEKVTGIKV
ncbi:MAG: hypothetical protein UT24_C0016G0023 [Candidatus Woesebacteria bacterium GW2011_GWB1_39_12]|uniref:Uncharacterized protein n=1 Tax=Candidatus Woesebacteria bacterium GW2011_GWB1_39_12 TaxID=1618574 RepID=A0A0G0M7P0_9BACT|nr:MAG: hypothetical protein UT24_C0016G0023 [Candidatus Woesebacteria bacterium GW2011_GWB1_39_12]